MYDIDRVKKEFYEACRKGGMTREIPVAFNGRLTRTHARVISDWKGNDLIPNRAEFSKQLIETATDDSIHEVILHEAAHAIVTELTRESHGHDAVFKKMCGKLGCSLDRASGEVERHTEVKNKYDLICPNCGVIGGYSRMCKAVREPERCGCKKCGTWGLKVKQNW